MSEKFFIIKDKHVALYCNLVSRDGDVIDGRVINGAWNFKLDTKFRHMWWYAPSGYDDVFDVEVMWCHYKSFDNYEHALRWARQRMTMSAPRRWLYEQGARIAFNWSAYTARLRKTIRAAKLAWDGAPAKPLIDEDDWPL